MFGRQPPDEPPLTQQEVNNLEDEETVIVEPPRTKPSEWTISTEGTVPVAEKFAHRLVLEPVGDGFDDTCVWRSYETADEFEVDAGAIVSELKAGPEEQTVEIDREPQEDDVSESAAARQLLRRGMEYDELNQEAERLNRERRQLLEQRDEHSQLVEYVEDEQRHRQTGLVQRVKWFLRGID